MPSALLVRPGGLGDLLILLPSLGFLRPRFDRLVLAGDPAGGRLLREAGLVDAAGPVDDPALKPLFDEGPDSGPGFESAGGFDELRAWFLHDPPGVFGRRCRALFARRGRIAVYAPESGVTAARQFFEDTVRWEGFNPGEFVFDDLARLPVPQGWRDAPVPASPFALVHPGSGGRAKCWPLERFFKLIGRLAARGWNGLVLTGPAEEAIAARVARHVFPRGWSHLSGPDLRTAAGLAARCDLYVGNDSGMTHLAAATGALVLALFLDAHVPAWRPFGRTTVLSAPALDALTVEQAAREISRLTSFVL